MVKESTFVLAQKVDILVIYSLTKIHNVKPEIVYVKAFLLYIAKVKIILHRANCASLQINHINSWINRPCVSQAQIKLQDKHLLTNNMNRCPRKLNLLART
jgi:hypothetical protein